MRSFHGKKALVTGAASGIGSAIVMALAKEGTSLWLVDIDEASLASTAREAESRGATVATSVCDLADPEQISAVVRSVLSTWGGLNILVNSAGIAHYGPMHLIPGDEWQRILSVNLLAPIQLVRELFATLVAQDEAHILNICSMFGLFPFRRLSAYQTSKFGLVGFTLALRGEYQRPDFGITALCPGFVVTAMIESSTRAGGHLLAQPPRWICTSADKVAAHALTAMRKNKGLVLITPVAKMGWWLMRLSPTLLDWLNREGWRVRRKVKFKGDRASF
jgi:3-oxoacyl-[acyl-carrier protein] reductase